MSKEIILSVYDVLWKCRMFKDALETEESVETQILNVSSCWLLLSGHELWILKWAHEALIWNMVWPLSPLSLSSLSLSLSANPRQWHWPAANICHLPLCFSGSRCSYEWLMQYLVFTGPWPHTLLPHASALIEGSWVLFVSSSSHPFVLVITGLNGHREQQVITTCSVQRVYKSSGQPDYWNRV